MNQVNTSSDGEWKGWGCLYLSEENIVYAL